MRNLKYHDSVKVIDSSGKSLSLPGLFIDGNISQSKSYNLLVNDKDYNTCLFAGSLYEYLQNKILLCEMASNRNGSVLTKKSMLNLKNICIEDEVHLRLSPNTTNLKLLMRGWIGGNVSSSYRIKIFQGSIEELKEYVNTDEFKTVVNHFMVD